MRADDRAEDRAALPDDTAGVREERHPRAAGGLAAITQSARAVADGPGLVAGARALLKMNQADGFDCPGCAWPEPPAGDRAIFEFCENGAKALGWEADRRRLDAAFFDRWSVGALAAESDHWLGQQGRLVEPLWLPAGETHYRPIAWDDAFAVAADALAALDGPEQAVFYTSGRTSNEAAYLYQLFARRLGTNNLPDCSNLCHESSGVALKEAIGVGKGTVQLDDFARADVILVIGQNPGTNHPRMMTTLEAAARRGARIISVNPLPELALARFRHPQHPLEVLGRGTAIAARHIPVRVGGDVAFFKGVQKALVEEDVRRRGQAIDRAFVAAHTEGFEAYAEALEAAPWDLLVEESGVAEAEMRALAATLAGTHQIVACWAMGLTQHVHAIANVQEIVNLLLLRGAIGRPGAGVCPVRGHSNVQGDRTMGIDHRPPAAFLDALAARYRFAPPRAHGLDVVGAIEAMEAGDAKLFFALGGNFLSASPDTARTARALARCALTAHVSTKLNRSHLVTGRQALILPCLGRSERDVQAAGPQLVTVEDSMGIVHASQGAAAPAGAALRSEPAIVVGLARAVLGDADGVRWSWLVEDYDRIRDEIAAVVPGFEDMNARVRVPGGFVLPNPARQRRFLTAGGRARFTVHPVPRPALAPGELLLTTIRSHDQYNTTIYGLDDRYRGISGGRRVVFMNDADIRALGLAPGMLVDLESRFGAETRVAPHFKVVPYPIAPRSAAAYFPEANPLVPLGQRAPGSRTPASKSIVIRVTARGASPPPPAPPPGPPPGPADPRS
jgi:molybdopterin-dependent oxidoreductase alpha subunit